jgi:putative membrane protein
MVSALFSALHVLGVGIALGAIFSRGLALRALADGDSRAVRHALFADNFWGISALVLVVTGLTRLFGKLDKQPDFYLYNGFFWIKMGLFLTVLAIEIAPMATLMRWRFALRQGGSPDTSRAAARLIRLNDAQTVIVIAIPFVAAAMARGVWLLE